MKRDVTPPLGRERLATVIRQAGTVLRPGDVAEVLGMDPGDAARLLYRWKQQGFLSRLTRGLYAAVPLESLGAGQGIENPWVLVPILFAPGYVGGWSAAEHWDLTEQVFRDVCVLTAQPVKRKVRVIGGTRFVLKSISESKVFGLKPSWEGRHKIQISDPARTLVDVLDDPTLGGGARQVADFLAVYLRSDFGDTTLLLEYADRLGNGAVFKRLGFLLEHQGLDPDGLQAVCRSRLSAGHALLDPSVASPRIVSKWRLRVTENWLVGRD